MYNTTKIFSLLLLITIFFCFEKLIAQATSDNNPDFQLTTDGICVCTDAGIGETGTFFTGTPNEITYTKRTRAELNTLILNDETGPEIALTCTSGITDMSNLFYFKSNFNQDISSWDVSNVIYMSRMFSFASTFNQPLNNWEVSNVTDMLRMFRSANSFNQPLNNWDVSNVTDMGNMFNSADAFNQPLNNWEVSNVTYMSFMFDDASQFNQDISNWCVENFASEPSLFSTNSPLQASFKPNWGAPCTSDFYEDNGICKCENANFGDTGIVNIGGVDKTFTKRTRAQLDALIANDETDAQIALTCISGITDMSFLFQNKNLFNQDISHWDTSNVTDMTAMFFLAGAFNQPVNDWDVSNVTKMDVMFHSADAFNQPVNGWDVSNVTSMFFMFYFADAFNQPVNVWDVSNVTNMDYMFFFADAFNQPLNDWDVSNVTNMEYMFSYALAFNQPLNNWNTSNVNNMRGMFEETDTFNQGIGSWDVSNVIDMSQMFSGASAFNQDISNWCVENFASEPNSFSTNSPLQASFKPNWGAPCTSDFYEDNGICKCENANFGDTGIVNIGGVDKTFTKRTRAELDTLIDNDQTDPEIALTCTSGITDMSNLFSFKSNFNQDISSWDTSNVIDMDSMFANTNLFNQPLNNWDVSNVTTMKNMFDFALSFNQPLNNWDVSNVTNMINMFDFAVAFNQNIGDWDTSNVTNMVFMFNNADAFNQPLNNWDVSNVTDMSDMFNSANIFNQPLNNWDVSNVIDMSFMFYNASQFNQDISSWDTSNVIDMDSMFAYTNIFNQPLNNWDVSNVTKMIYMFNSADAFNQPLNNWDVSSVTQMSAMFLGADVFNQDISNWCVENFASEPNLFSTNFPLQASFKPNWGEPCTTNTWTGTADPNWSNITNWSMNVLPVPADNVSIRPDAPFMPEVNTSTTAEVNNLIALDGTVLDVYGILKVNNRLHNNGNLNFKSNATSTGQFDEFTGSLSGKGGVLVERHIPQSNRAFRYIGSSVNTTESINANLQEGATTASVEANPHPGYGTHITGGSTANGFDTTQTNNPSMFEWDVDAQTWQAVTQTLPKPMNIGEAYALMIRGDRSTDLNSNESLGPATTLRFRGNIQTGDFLVDSGDLAQTVNEFSLLVNPYQAIVNMKTLLESLDASGLDSQTIYVYDPTLGSRGGYATIDLSLADPLSTPYDDGISGTTNADENLLPNQAFFIKTTASNPSLTFKETYKNTTGTFTDTFSDEEELSVIHVNLKRQSDLSLSDGVTLRFNNNWSNAVDDHDASKFWNYDERVAVYNTNTYLAIEKRALPQDNEMMQLYTGNYKETDYIWQISLQNINREVFLYDAYLDTETLLQQNAITDVIFSTDAGLSESIDPWRFSLEFGSETLSQNQVELSQLSVYPNPVTDYKFRILGIELQKNTEIELIDVLGRSVFKTKKDISNETGISIDSNLQAGVYQLIISQGSASYHTKLIIKN